MNLIIRIDDLSGAQIQALLEEHLVAMNHVSPPESIHALGLAQLQRPEITFWSAWIEESLAGCGALKEINPHHGEIKSMRTSSGHLRQGVAHKCCSTSFRKPSSAAMRGSAWKLARSHTLSQPGASTVHSALWSAHRLRVMLKTLAAYSCIVCFSWLCYRYHCFQEAGGSLSHSHNLP